VGQAQGLVVQGVDHLVGGVADAVLRGFEFTAQDGQRGVQFVGDVGVNARRSWFSFSTCSAITAGRPSAVNPALSQRTGCDRPNEARRASRILSGRGLSKLLTKT
jgi:hypothetical protein